MALDGNGDRIVQSTKQATSEKLTQTSVWLVLRRFGTVGVEAIKVRSGGGGSNDCKIHSPDGFGAKAYLSSTMPLRKGRISPDVRVEHIPEIRESLRNLRLTEEECSKLHLRTTNATR